MFQCFNLEASTGVAASIKNKSKILGHKYPNWSFKIMQSSIKQEKQHPKKPKLNKLSKGKSK